MMVRAMCATGMRGQMGLGGRMPWEGSQDPVFAADAERFWRETEWAVLLVGPKTHASIPPEAHRGREIVLIRSSMQPGAVLDRFRDRAVFVGGGAAVWRAYAPYIGHWDITRLPYDGAADMWFEPAWLGLDRPAG